MWFRRCPQGVRSCFKAQGNWGEQKPLFRGCAGAKYEHGTKCKRELQRVLVTPGKPRVDVEVYLCYCTGDECNKEDITAGGARVGGIPIRFGGFVSSVINIVLTGVIMYVLTVE